MKFVRDCLAQRPIAGETEQVTAVALDQATHLSEFDRNLTQRSLVLILLPDPKRVVAPVDHDGCSD